MGGDIAAWCALRGLTVTLQDRALEFIEPAIKRAHELFDKRVKDPGQKADARKRIEADVAGAGVDDADVVIEAIFEDLNAKQALYASLEPRMKPTALLATNTSSITLEPLAAKLANPARLVGLHFFNPVAQMPLIEIVSGAQTDPAAAQAAVAFSRRLDKLPVPCTSAPGFIVNRVLMPYLQEAMRVAQEGVALTGHRQGGRRFRHAHGPRGARRRGRPRRLPARRQDHRRRAGARGAEPLTQLEELVAQKKLGRKTGSGFYEWKDGKAIKPPTGGVAAPARSDRSD